jgi:hypothetical protein
VVDWVELRWASWLHGDGNEFCDDELNCGLVVMKIGLGGSRLCVLVREGP